MRFAVGFLLGILALGVVRFVFTPWPDAVHHHANWAVYVDGQRLDLTADRYMEDVSACSAGDALQPEQRVHMHEGNHDVVHVHDDGVTWGHLATNLGWAMGSDWVELEDGQRLEDDGERRLVFVVNGFVVPSLHDRLVGSGDRALIAWGTDTDETVRDRIFPQVASTAPEFNQRFDPAGCSGGHGELPFGARLRRAFWW